MKDRAKKARRLMEVLHKLHQVEEQKKMELQRKLVHLEEMQRYIFAALNSENPLHRSVADLTAQSLGPLSQEIGRVSLAKDEQLKRLLEGATKLKRAEKLHDELDDKSRRQNSEKELLETIERYAAKRNASLP